MHKYIKNTQHYSGGAPGIEHDEIASLPERTGQVRVTCIDYGPGQVAKAEIENIEEFIELHRPEWTTVRWIMVEGLSDMNIIRTLATKYSLHPLAIEDMLHQSQRSKVDSYGGDESEFIARLFIVTHVLQVRNDRIQHDQVSIFLGHKTVMTFQENSSTTWDPVRQRIDVKGSRIRNSDASFLAYSLLDAIIDSCFPILESYSTRAEELETRILDQTGPNKISEIHQLKRDLLLLRWVVWPMREVVSYMQREHNECISETTRIYLRDLYDHVVQIIDLTETYREIVSDLTETHISSVSNRMNEIMKVLTIIGTIFIPLTFLAGVYGMNFHYFPELDKVWAYPAFWLICLVTAGIMLFLFHRKKWL
ncbi:MAG: magnesium/cobalt transporter CorA [Chitinophagaceae bacterium]